MFRRRRTAGRRTLALIASVTIVGGAAAVTAAARPHGALAAGGGTVVATPATALTDGQFAKLTFSGFPGNTALDFLQCNASPADPNTDCTPFNSHFGFAVTDPTGAGSTYFPVYDGTDPLLENAAGTGTLTCDNSHACVIAAYVAIRGFSSAQLVQLSFAPSPDLCPQVQGGKILGNGSASAFRALYQWESAVCQPPQSLPVGYTLGNSPFGVNDFMQGITQYAVTGPWAPDYAPQATGATPQSWAYAPLTMSGVVIAYRMYNRDRSQITSLTLTPDLIAKIFLGEVPNFNPGTFNCASQPTYPPCEIAALNPGLQLPTIVYPYVRAESDSESWVFTSWLASAAPTAWVHPPGPNAGSPIGASEIFPALSSFVTPATGSAAVGVKVVTPPTGSGFPLSGNIGFMDSSTAAYYGLPTVNIKRADGSVTQADTASIKQAIADATLNSDGTVVPNYATTDPKAWPMLLPTMMLVPTNKVSVQTGAAIATFLRYTVGAGQATLPAGYAGLTDPLLQAADAAATKIPASASGPTPTPTSTASPTPIPVVISPPPVSNPGLGLGPGATPSAGGIPPSGKVGGKKTAAAKASPTPQAATTASAPAARLLVSTDDSRFFLPAAAALALGALVAGGVTELLGRRRRRALPKDGN